MENLMLGVGECGISRKGLYTGCVTSSLPSTLQRQRAYIKRLIAFWAHVEEPCGFRLSQAVNDSPLEVVFEAMSGVGFGI